MYLFVNFYRYGEYEDEIAMGTILYAVTGMSQTQLLSFMSGRDGEWESYICLQYLKSTLLLVALKTLGAVSFFTDDF